MTSLITHQLLDAEPVLRLLQGKAQAMTATQIAKETDRDPSNVRKGLQAFEAAGLLIGESDVKGTAYRISPAGVAGLEALDGQGAVGLPLWPLDAIDYNPDNPRKSVAQEALEGLADTIAEAEGLLQPIVLYPAGANGVRMLHAGERRVRACRLLQAQGRLPPALQAGLPFIEREASKAQALFIGLVENSQRENLSPFEDAQALKAFQDETGLSARAIAFKLGRAREGSEEGVRDVQEKIKVLTRAKPEAIARVQAGRESFDWLRQQVRKRIEDVGQQLRPVDILTLAEVKLQARRKPKRFSYGERETECSYKAGKDPILKGLVSQGLLAFTEQARDDHKAYVEIRHAALEIFNTEELAGIYGDLKTAEELVRQLRIEAFGQGGASVLSMNEEYATTWLNGPFTLSEKAQALVDAAKVTRRELIAANKAKNAAHKARVEEATAIVVAVEEHGLAGPAIDAVVLQLGRSKIKFPLRVENKNIVDGKGDAVFYNGMGWRFAEDQDVLMPLLVAVLNSVLAPTPLEAAIAKAQPDPQAQEEAHAAA
ncbi:ParB/RepB/Spo0J family partition protein [Caulobacter vibrioides]|nr:ParB/RepB/Spo0J family partition protein [Caulobacter vibrioides]